MNNIIHQALNIFFPEMCVHCAQPQNSPLLLCSNCLQELPQQLHTIQSPELISQLWGMAEYNSPAGTLIRRCKYKPDPYILKTLVSQIKSKSIPWNQFDLITHVPTSFFRRYARGFDQSQYIAKFLSQRFGLTYAPLLQRKDLSVQSQKTYKDRKSQLSVRFRSLETPPPRILLIDDVCTTGSTLEACAMTLLNEGAYHVSGIVLCY